MYIKITNMQNEITDVEARDRTREFTDKQKEKQKLILEIKRESAKGRSDRSIAK
ncbi:hypothetical protein [Schnuerera ultunensis]|nr:hypothetical protein [Schnuerera ultunensis]